MLIHRVACNFLFAHLSNFIFTLFGLPSLCEIEARSARYREIKTAMAAALDVVGNYASLLLTVEDFVPDLEIKSTAVLAEALLASDQISVGSRSSTVAVRPAFLAQVLQKVQNEDDSLELVVSPLFDAALERLRPIPPKIDANTMASMKALITVLAHKATAASFVSRGDFLVSNEPPPPPVAHFFAQFQPPSGRTGRSLETNTALGLVRSFVVSKCEQ